MLVVIELGWSLGSILPGRPDEGSEKRAAKPSRQLSKTPPKNLTLVFFGAAVEKKGKKRWMQWRPSSKSEITISAIVLPTSTPSIHPNMQFLYELHFLTVYWRLRLPYQLLLVSVS